MGSISGVCGYVALLEASEAYQEICHLSKDTINDHVKASKAGPSHEERYLPEINGSIGGSVSSIIG